MPRVAIIDQAVSAGGVERFLHGLIGGAIEERITDNWEILLVRNRYNSARIHVPWPDRISTPRLKIEYLAENNVVSRLLNRLAISGRISGIPGTGMAVRKFASTIRAIGSDQWKAYCGETRRWIESYFRKQHFDVAYFSFPYFLEPPEIELPIVATPHDFTYKHGLSTSVRTQQLLDHQMTKWLERCSRVVVSSQFVADDLRGFYPAWSHKAEVIRLGIPTAARDPSAEEVEAFRRRYGLPEKFVLVVGWLVEHKNQKVVFEAVSNLRDRGVRVPVVCVGPNSHVLNESELATFRGPAASSYAAQILEFCKRARLKNGIDYFSLGFVDDFAVECLYRSAMMLVVPTITEAGSFPAREAMRAGCPVAFSQIPVFEEEMSLLHGNAWSFPTNESRALADVIEQVSKNGEEARRRAAAAKEIVPNVFCWRNTARGYFSVFERLAKSEESRASANV